MKKKKIICLIAIGFVLLLFLPLCLLYIPYERQMGIQDTVPFFENEKVLFLMPHQDDEIYMAASTILNYVSAGSEVMVAYATNGDFYGEEYTSIRRDEAEAVLNDMGVPSENIYFFGYPNQYAFGDTEFLYTHPGIIQSQAGHNGTYGTEKYPDYHSLRYKESAEYTRANFKADIAAFLLEQKPTTIYCVDFDVHVDHRTLSLVFEEIMADILKKETTYKPKVYKGFAYKDDRDDFYADIHQLSIAKPIVHRITDATSDTDVPAYLWNERLRLPAAKNIHGWTRRGSYLNKLFEMYVSQKDRSFACNANSDDIFWERRTDSLTYTAGLSVTSGANEERLRDFKLTDVTDIASYETKYTDFLWQPHAEDEEKTVTFSFSEKMNVNTVVLYDDPNADNNILLAEIMDENGNVLATCTPYAGGGRSQVSFAPTDTTSISVRIREYEGTPGLAEVEIFHIQDETKIVKLYLDNENETFVYRVYPNTENVGFGVYSYPPDDKIEQNYDVSVNGDATWKWENGKLVVSGDFSNPIYLIVINKENNELTDTVMIEKMPALTHGYFSFLQTYERTMDKGLWWIQRYVPYYWGLLIDKINGMVS